MTAQGDTKRPRSVNLEFDPDFNATPMGGGVLIEQTLRSLGIRKLLGKHLPARSEAAIHAMDQFAAGAIAALLAGGDGMDLFNALSGDAPTPRIFGLEEVPSPSTTYRLLCELGGLAQRRAQDVYVPAESSPERLDMFGEPLRAPARRRLVPDCPEAADAACRQALRAAEQAVALRCGRSLQQPLLRMHGWSVLFGDGEDLEVEGRCFDAACMGREGQPILRWLTLWLGPILAAQELMEGSADEGRSIPALLEHNAAIIREIAGKGRILALMDSAFCERQVVQALLARPLACDCIIGANQYRGALERIAREQPAMVWRDTGADARRGWSASQVCVFTHRFEGWETPVTIAARRWRQAGEFEIAPWHYAFLASNIEPAAMPAKLRKQYGYAGALWALYSTKQGRENHHKTPLRCLGLHHPPSGRLGVNQAYYALAAMATNVAMVMRHAVLPAAERGMTLTRMRPWYFRVAGYLVRSGRKLIVRLAGAAVDPCRQRLILEAFANARRL